MSVLKGIGIAVRGIGKALKGSKKLKDPKMLKVKPLSERKVFGKGEAEKIMKEVEKAKTERIKAEQAANVTRMKLGEETKPLKSSAKKDIEIAIKARTGKKNGGRVNKNKKGRKKYV